nr:hypothetical protein [Ferrimicrobium acidiphilum]
MATSILFITAVAAFGRPGPFSMISDELVRIEAPTEGSGSFPSLLLQQDA